VLVLLNKYLVRAVIGVAQRQRNLIAQVVEKRLCLSVLLEHGREGLCALNTLQRDGA
jgi:hypothetical protein